MKKFILVLSAISLLFISCTKTPDYPTDKVRIAIPDDVTTFNPMFSFTISEGVVSELLYLPLVKHEWNNTTKAIEPVNYLASSWKWVNEKSLEVVLKKNIYWSDGKPVTLDDVIFSLVVYSDPESKSKFYGYFTNYITDENEKIVSEKSFQVQNDSTLLITFNEHGSPNLLDIDFPIIPKHFFGELNIADLENSEKNLQPVTNGPYKIKSWVRNSSLLLEPVENHFLITDKNTPDIEFVVVSDYQARILKLSNGEIDIIQDIIPEDVEEINNSNLAYTDEVKGRDYDYIGWNNIDPEAFENGKSLPNKLFGSAKVREALSTAINRELILKDYLKGKGTLSNGPVTPTVFENYKPVTDLFNPEKAIEILKAEGWTDSDNDGILDRDGTKFEFDLTIVTGSKRKKYAAEIVKSNLEKIGVKANIKNIEYNNFIDNLMSHKIDAWVGGWYIPLPVELRVYWYSDFREAPMNFAGYQNAVTDSLLNDLANYPYVSPPKEKLEGLQEQIFSQHPVTFLYWVDQVFGINKRVKNIDVNPLGAIHSCWEWRID